MSKTLIMLDIRRNHGHHTLINTILIDAYYTRVPIFIEEIDNSKELLIKAATDLEKSCNEASFKLRETAFERRNPNQPWWRKFNNKSKRK